MRVLGEHHVQLGDGTVWAVDRPTTEDRYSLEWVLRYGTPDEVYRHRLSIASVISSYKALLCEPQKRRNQIVSQLREGLAAMVIRSTERKEGDA